MNRILVASLLVSSIAPLPALAADKPKDELPQVTKCEKSFGTIAVTDGDAQGWTQFGLGSPRTLIAALVAESGCFTMHDMATGQPANFLMSAVAGSKEEVDRTVGAVKSAAAEGLVRSGALGRMGGGAFGALGMLGGLGGKKKTVAAGLRVLSPATGMTIAQGSGESSKSAITFGNAGGWGWGNSLGSAATGYTSSKDGQLLTSAFINAYNAVIAQSSAIAAVPAVAAQSVAPPKPASDVMASTSIDTKLFAEPGAGAILQTLAAGTIVTPTGNRMNGFVEVKDAFGTQGWVAASTIK
jgi:hypothetical protein